MIEQKLSGADIAPAPFFRLYEVGKRVADIVISAVLLVLLTPLFVVVSLWVLLDSRGPIFFCQRRIGRNGRNFRIIKFRTMTANAEANGPQVTSKNDTRITKCGRILRSWKIDELPQLFNVLWGDMSLVGPRPQVPKYVELFPALQREKILSVRPGITGPTAIRFRHEEEMLQNRENREQFYIDVLLPLKCHLDEEYVDSRGAAADFSALWRTGAMLVHGVYNRLRGIPVGETVEYDLPEERPRPSGYAVVRNQEGDALAKVAGE